MLHLEMEGSLVSECSDFKSMDSNINSTNVELDSDSEIEELDSDEWEAENPIDNNDCLFCFHHSRTFIKNLEHMTIVHSFFIPDIEYCTDVTGLLKYLGEKVSEGIQFFKLTRIGSLTLNFSQVLCVCGVMRKERHFIQLMLQDSIWLIKVIAK